MKRKCTENKCSHFVQLRRPSQGFGGTGTRAFLFSGEQGDKNIKIRGTGEHRQFWGTGNIENQDFVFGEQGHFFEGNNGTGTPLKGPH